MRSMIGSTPVSLAEILLVLVGLDRNGQWLFMAASIFWVRARPMRPLTPRYTDVCYGFLTGRRGENYAEREL